MAPAQYNTSSSSSSLEGVFAHGAHSATHGQTQDDSEYRHDDPVVVHYSQDPDLMQQQQMMFMDGFEGVNGMEPRDEGSSSEAQVNKGSV